MATGDDDEDDDDGGGLGLCLCIIARSQNSPNRTLKLNNKIQKFEVSCVNLT